MSDHVVQWEWAHGDVTGKVACEAPPGADCRLIPDRSTCQCDEWGAIHTEDDGRRYHAAYDFEDIEHRHYMTPNPDRCLIVEWMDAEDAAEYAVQGQARFPIGKTPVETTWLGDGYEWRAAQ